MSNFKFSEEEWNTCIKVLSILKDNPFENPDNQTLKTLITYIHKKVKKEHRSLNESLRQIENAAVIKNTRIARNALNNTASYWAEEIQTDNEFTPLSTPLSCYACNNSYNHCHFFYSRLCPQCARDHYQRRFHSTDLSGYNVILTGARVKIGYASCLKLLRSGANVIATTRFPALLLEALSNEPDYEQWKDRIIAYGLDLRNLHAVEEFIHFVRSEFSHLDILINNAAQTIRYTDNYYAPLIAKEEKASILLTSKQLVANTTNVLDNTKNAISIDAHLNLELNRFGQPIDNREKNSWNSTLDQISMLELLEVNLINQISPYLLIKDLKPLFIKSPHPDRFIINVTSSEGQFSYTNKTIFHPHTNMTKAALNMLTRTSAEDFAEDHIFMNSVDVGWVSTGAIESLRKKQFERGYMPPLDPVDGASRIFQPILDVIAMKQEPVWGKLLKNYVITNW